MSFLNQKISIFDRRKCFMRKFLLFIFGFGFLGALLAGCDSRAPERVPVADFFSYADKSHFRISPDGRYISYLSTMDKNAQQDSISGSTGDEKHIFLLD